MNSEILIKLNVQEYKTIRDLYEAADKFLFISPIGRKGSLQFAAWKTLRDALDNSRKVVDL